MNPAGGDEDGEGGDSDDGGDDGEGNDKGDGGAGRMLARGKLAPLSLGSPHAASAPSSRDPTLP